jgi:hypothetical protein
MGFRGSVAQAFIYKPTTTWREEMSTTKAWTGTEEMGWNRRVEPRPEPQAVVDRRTPTQRASDFYFEKHMREEAEKKAEEERQEKLAREQRLKARADAEKKRRQAEFQFQETLIADALDRAGLTAPERATVMQQLLDTTFSAERATILAMQIVAERPQRKLPEGCVEVGEKD